MLPSLVLNWLLWFGGITVDVRSVINCIKNTSCFNISNTDKLNNKRRRIHWPTNGINKRYRRNTVRCIWPNKHTYICECLRAVNNITTVNVQRSKNEAEFRHWSNKGIPWKFEVLKAVTTDTALSWHVPSCSLVDTDVSETPATFTSRLLSPEHII